MSTGKKNLIGLVPGTIVDFVDEVTARWNQKRIDIVIYGLQLVAEKHGLNFPEGFGYKPDSLIYQDVPKPKPTQKK